MKGAVNPFLQRMSNTNYSTKVIRGEYFPHVDGIRALAVLPVVLFHALAACCPGGFTGVDVFFVISGYLITGGILRDLENGRFTILNFYHRRIRRIMPAYFAMIAGVFATGCTLYYATPLIPLGDAVVAATLFLANVYFWLQGGNYFGRGLHTQALLHLWSLSVEEQFYFFIPLLCAIIWKLGRRLVAPALALLAVLSLSGAIYAVMMGKQYNAFYFLHYRAWELLAGSLLATLSPVPKVTGARPRPHNSLLPAQIEAPHDNTGMAGALAAGKARHAFLATVGLLMVLISFAVISSKTPFPGAAALPPVMGTVLLIRYGQSGWVSRLLSCRLLVLTGKISYSLYLWHWPVIVFWRYAAYDQLCSYDYIGMFFLSLLLGYLSWRFVELPARTSSMWTVRRSFAFAVAGMALLVALGTACVYYRGWPTILHPEANGVAYMPPPRDPFLLARTLAVVRRIGSQTGRDFKVVVEHEQCVQQQLSAFLARGHDGRFKIGASGQPVVLLLGDSHAGSLRYGLDAFLRERRISGYAITCAGTDMFDSRLPESRSALEKLSELSRVSHIVLVQMWQRSIYLEEQEQPMDVRYAQLEEFSARVKAMGKTLLITTDVPQYRHALTDIEARLNIVAPRDMGIVLDSRQQSDVEYDREQGDINGKLAGICKKTGAVLIPLHLAFKQDDHYVCFEATGGETTALYRDRDHLSMAGSLRAARFFTRYLPDRGK